MAGRGVYVWEGSFSITPSSQHHSQLRERSSCYHIGLWKWCPEVKGRKYEQKYLDKDCTIPNMKLYFWGDILSKRHICGFFQFISNRSAWVDSFRSYFPGKGVPRHHSQASPKYGSHGTTENWRSPKVGEDYEPGGFLFSTIWDQNMKEQLEFPPRRDWNIAEVLEVWGPVWS